MMKDLRHTGTEASYRARLMSGKKNAALLPWERVYSPKTPSPTISKKTGLRVPVVGREENYNFIISAFNFNTLILSKSLVNPDYSLPL